MNLRSVVVMLVLAALAVLAYVTLSGGDGPAARLDPTYPRFEQSDVSVVTLRHRTETLEMRRRADRSDSWDVVSGVTTCRADGAVIEDLLVALRRQGVRTKFDAAKLAPADLQGFGLASPETSLEMKLPSSSVTVRFGKSSMDGSMYVDGGPGTDVWVVENGCERLVIDLLANGARSRRLTDLRLFDVGAVEVVRGGITSWRVERDPSGIWRVKQPFDGFAEPTRCETRLSRLVNTEVAAWVDIGAADLVKYGLDAPSAEVRLEPRQGGDPTVILVGKEAGPDTVYVMEKGIANVATLHRRLADAAAEPAVSMRDDSFTRLGIDGISVRVRFGDLTYKLAKAGASWEIAEPERQPADERAVRDLLEALRSWKTVEWQDGAKPADHGIGDEQFIEVELGGGAKSTYRIGREATGGTWWAARTAPDGAGGVERVQGEPVAMVRKGWPQFRQKLVRDFTTYMDQLVRVERASGTSEEGQKVQELALTRDIHAVKPVWRFEEGPGIAGTLKNDAVARLISALTTVHAREWQHYDPAKNDEYGFANPRAALTSLVLKFDDASEPPRDGAVQKLYLGNRLPGGGCYARFGDTPWVFIAGDDLIAAAAAVLVQ
ncbi:MAG: hypothetical protein HMLKMBBP_01019 [Planctomycetes bacterium]|nr:hypothetical protein [Planctomycetota bacterium]